MEKDTLRNPKGAGRIVDRKASDTRDKLIASARKLFSSSSFEGIKVSDIVAGAGVSKGTFYYHFEDKETVLITILEDFFSKCRTLGDSWAETKDTGPEVIASLVRSVVTLVHDNQDIIRIMTGESIVHDRRVSGLIKEFYSNLYDRATRGMELGIKIGAIRACNARIASVAHIGMIKEVIQDQLDNGQDGQIDPEYIASEILQLIYYGVRSPHLRD